MPKFKDKVVIITGSTRGIGLATAKAFLGEGANVVIFCRHDEHGEEALKEIEREGFGLENVRKTHGDVHELWDVRGIVNETQEEFGKIDILINNAGIAHWKPIEEHEEEDYDEVMNTNLKGSWLFSREVVPHMKRQKYGRIIMTSSGLGLSGDKNYSAYSPSKFGMIGLAQTLEAELGSKMDFHAYSVCPGGVATQLHLGAHPWENPEDMMKPEDIAPYFLDAAEDKADPRKCIEAFKPY